MTFLPIIPCYRAEPVKKQPYISDWFYIGPIPICWDWERETIPIAKEVDVVNYCSISQVMSFEALRPIVLGTSLAKASSLKAWRREETETRVRSRR